MSDVSTVDMIEAGTVLNEMAEDIAALSMMTTTLFNTAAEAMKDRGVSGKAISAALATAAADVYARVFTIAMKPGTELKAFDESNPKLRDLVAKYVADKTFIGDANTLDQGHA